MGLFFWIRVGHSRNSKNSNHLYTMDKKIKHCTADRYVESFSWINVINDFEHIHNTEHGRDMFMHMDTLLLFYYSWIYFNTTHLQYGHVLYLCKVKNSRFCSSMPIWSMVMFCSQSYDWSLPIFIGHRLFNQSVISWMLGLWIEDCLTNQWLAWCRQGLWV